MPNLNIIEHPKTLMELAYDRLHASLLNGDITWDQNYSEAFLAEKLGISRTPIREALLKLTEKGLMTFLPRKGVIVRKFSKNDIREIYETRKILENYAVKKVIDLGEKNDFSELEKALKNQETAISEYIVSGYLQANREFHRSMIKMVNNSRILNIYDTIIDSLQLIAMQILSFDEKRMEKVHKEHKMLLANLKKRDLKQALHLIEAHIDDSENKALTNAY